MIVENFGAGAARAGFAHLPEIVFFIEAENARLRHASDFLPKLFGIVVFAKHGYIQLVFRQAVPLRTGDELPGKGNGVGFEVIAKGEIAEHFEKCVVAARVAHIFQVVKFAACADALLGRGGARVVAALQAEKYFFKLIHARVVEQQRGVVCGYQRRAAYDAMPLPGEELKELGADLMASHYHPF